MCVSLIHRLHGNEEDGRCHGHAGGCRFRCAADEQGNILGKNEEDDRADQSDDNEGKICGARYAFHVTIAPKRHVFGNTLSDRHRKTGGSDIDKRRIDSICIGKIEHRVRADDIGQRDLKAGADDLNQDTGHTQNGGAGDEILTAASA